MNDLLKPLVHSHFTACQITVITRNKKTEDLREYVLSTIMPMKRMYLCANL